MEALKRARTEVSSLEERARTQESALGEKQEAAARALDQITATARAAADAKDDMHALKANIQQENDKLQIRSVLFAHGSTSFSRSNLVGRGGYGHGRWLQCNNCLLERKFREKTLKKFNN